jgi:multidrug efflux pump
MMCARLLRAGDHDRAGWLARFVQQKIDGLIATYGVALRWVLARQGLTLVVALGTFVLTALLYVAIPKGFFPVQDTGLIQIVTQAPQNLAFSAMAERQQSAVKVILMSVAYPPLSVSMV